MATSATVASYNNANIEKIGSIKIYSSSSPTAAEQSGLVFGGYAYSADIQANNGDGYSISVKVISKDGSYKISASDLNVTTNGSKNIIIGNFTFFDFYLTSYSIDKEVENSILTLTYKDKSIFMDKVFIGLFTHHYGNLFDSNGKFIQQPGILNGEETIATFKYKCDDSPSGIKNAFLRRFLNRVQTIAASKTLLSKNSIKFPTSLPDFLSSDAFFSRYYYNANGVNGGYIILGREEINEENCSLPEVSYCFKDLTSALAYSDIPGVVDFNLGENQEIYRILRRKYFGSLRSVLDQWGNDLGFKFYFQPKIKFLVKDYKTDNSATQEKTINEGLKFINLVSTSQTLQNLNELFNPNNSDYKSLQKVIQSLSETATLEGTRKSNVITPIRREARSFNSSFSNITFKTANVLNLLYLSPFYFNDADSDDTVIGGTLSIYDPDLRDLYHLWKKNYKALGISDYKDLSSSDIIISKLDFLLSFGPSVTQNQNGSLSPSEVLDDYIILLAAYDESRHSLIKDWEKSIMTEYYGQYYSVSKNGEFNYCDSFTNRSITYETVPPSQSYIGNELPFAKLLYDRFGNDELDFAFGSKKYDPIFRADNPFDYRNESNFKTFSQNLTSYQSSKGLTVINLKDNSRAKMALFNCFDQSSANYQTFSDFIDNNNISLILCKKISGGASPITNIAITPTASGSNLSTILIGQGVTSTTDAKKNCPKTVCEISLSESICGKSSDNSINQSDTGFLSRSARVITISTISSSCTLILPATSNYRYAETQNSNSTFTMAGTSYVIGHPPIFQEYNGNVLSHEVIDNTVPEILTQSNNTGVVDQIITFNSDGKNSLVLSASDYHRRINNNLNNSVLEPFQQKKISLTSTYIPVQLVDYIFTSPILNSMNFTFDESGFNIVLDFSSRPKQPKQKDSLFLTERFLRKL